MLYGKKSGSDYIDNQRRFKLFNKAALSALTSLPFSPGTDAIIVCNDWHTALLPVLLKVMPTFLVGYASPLSVCVHDCHTSIGAWASH